jgi:hypothetical protein
MATTAKGYEREPMVVGIGDVDFAKYCQHEVDWGRDYDDQSTQVGPRSGRGKKMRASRTTITGRRKINAMKMPHHT